MARSHPTAQGPSLRAHGGAASLQSALRTPGVGEGSLRRHRVKRDWSSPDGTPAAGRTSILTTKKQKTASRVHVPPKSAALIWKEALCWHGHYEKCQPGRSTFTIVSSSKRSHNSTITFFSPFLTLWPAFRKCVHSLIILSFFTTFKVSPYFHAFQYPTG